jgi:hypothetical protein
MLTLPPSVRIYVAARPVDARKSFDGLAAMVESEFGLEPLSGHLFVFLNRRGHVAQLLFWDRNGFCILKNHPSSHYTSFDFRREPCFFADFRIAAARSTTRSHRLLCFTGRSAGSS